jgi:hypothetical protein
MGLRAVPTRLLQPARYTALPDSPVYFHHRGGEAADQEGWHIEQGFYPSP